MPLEQILAKNITALMQHIPDVGTVDKLSKRSGVSRGTVDRVKKGEVKTGIDTVEELANALGVSPIWLLIWHDDPVSELHAPPARAVDAMQAPATAKDPLNLTCETSQELRMLSVYRLSGSSGRQLIDVAIDEAAQDINLSHTLNERK